MSDEELSVGSPEDPLNESETTDNNLNSSSTNNISTAALRILRKRKNSEEENSSNTDTEKPLDFTNKKSSSNSEIQSSPLSQSVHNSYFLPYKNLEMNETSTAGSPTSPNSKFFEQAQNHVKMIQDANSVNAGGKSVKKRGVAGFSIDDILSHKTAALKEQKSQKEEQQPIVRPWDISSAATGYFILLPIHLLATESSDIRHFKTYLFFGQYF